MLRVLAVALGIICATPAAAAPPLACDITPAPVLCYGTLLLKTGYAGNAIDVHNPVALTSTSIGFVSGALDTATLDTFLGGNIGLVRKWYDQMGGVALANEVFIQKTATTNSTAIVTGIGTTAGLTGRMAITGNRINFSTILSTVDSGVQITMNQPSLSSGSTTLTFSDAPSIQGLTAGTIGARTIVFQGESISGAVFGMKTESSIAALNVTAQDYSVISVVNFASQLVTNQAGAPGTSSAALLDMQSSAPATVLQVINNGMQGFRGVFQVTDGAFDFKTNGSVPYGYSVPINTIVLGITSDSTGVKLYVNGEVRATAARSALTRTAANLYLGKLASSVAGATSIAGGFDIAAQLVYNVGLTQAQYGFVQSSLFQSFGLKPFTYNYNYITNFSDSIGAGYVTLGIKGYMRNLATLASNPVVVGSAAIPGSTNVQNPGAAVVPPTNQQGIVQPILCQTMPYFTKRRIAIIHVAGNDVFLGPPVRTGNTHTSTLIDNIGSTADLTVGDFVSLFGLTPLQSILSKTANSITLTGATSTTVTGAALIFTFAATNPTTQTAAIQAMVNQATACGATTVLVVPTLPRADGTQPWINAVNTAVIAGVTGATIVDCRAFGNLGSNPGVDYFDTGHMTAAGQTDMANCLLTAVNANTIP